MGKILRLIGSLIPLVFATIAIAFAIKATASKEWAERHYYNNTLEEYWTTPNVSDYRSPFINCGYFVTNAVDKNGTLTADEDLTFERQCISYPPFGRNKTSCEPWSVTGSAIDARTGDERLCQQIHWAGNLAIASTTFIGFGFLLTVAMTSIAVLAIVFSGTQKSDHSADPIESKTAVRTDHTAVHHSRRHRYVSPFTPYVNFTLTISFIFGSILYLLAQFYGVTGLVQSNPDNGQYAAYGEKSTNNEGYLHGPWIQSKALSVYASVAWLSAGLAATSAGLVWRLPSTSKSSPL